MTDDNGGFGGESFASLALVLMGLLVLLFLQKKKMWVLVVGFSSWDENCCSDSFWVCSCL